MGRIRPSVAGRGAFAIAAAGALVLALAGCTGSPRTPLLMHPAKHPASAAPTASSAPAAAPAPRPTAGGCHGWGFWEEDYLSEAQQPVDCGPIPYATGTARLDENGTPVAYIAAPGDIWEFIAKRFDLGTAYLTGINAVRRDVPSVVYAGDTINLDPATILTVGDEDGVVARHEDRLPDPHLPQH